MRKPDYFLNSAEGSTGAAHTIGNLIIAVDRVLGEVQPDLGIIVETELHPEDVPGYRQAGAAALVVGAPLFSGPTQTMADLITQARRFTQAWQNSSSWHEKRSLNGRH